MADFATTLDGKPIQAGDFVTVVGTVSSVSMPNITVSVNNSEDITALATNFNGPSVSGAGRLEDGPLVGSPVSGRGVVVSTDGFGPTATVVVQFTEKTVSVQSQDTYASQSL